MWALTGEEGADSVAANHKEPQTARSYSFLKAYEPDGMCYKFIGNTEGHRDTYLPTTKETYKLQLSAADTLYAEGKTSIRLCSVIPRHGDTGDTVDTVDTVDTLIRISPDKMPNYNVMPF